MTRKVCVIVRPTQADLKFGSDSGVCQLIIVTRCCNTAWFIYMPSTPLAVRSVLENGLIHHP